MTKDQIIDALKKGSLNTTSKFVNVRRDHLLIALGAEPEPKDEEPSVVADPAAADQS